MASLTFESSVVFRDENTNLDKKKSTPRISKENLKTPRVKERRAFGDLSSRTRSYDDRIGENGKQRFDEDLMTERKQGKKKSPVKKPEPESTNSHSVEDIELPAGRLWHEEREIIDALEEEEDDNASDISFDYSGARDDYFKFMKKRSEAAFKAQDENCIKEAKEDAERLLEELALHDEKMQGDYLRTADGLDESYEVEDLNKLVYDSDESSLGHMIFSLEELGFDDLDSDREELTI